MRSGPFTQVGVTTYYCSNRVCERATARIHRSDKDGARLMRRLNLSSRFCLVTVPFYHWPVPFSPVSLLCNVHVLWWCLAFAKTYPDSRLRRPLDPSRRGQFICAVKIMVQGTIANSRFPRNSTLNLTGDCSILGKLSGNACRLVLSINSGSLHIFSSYI